MGTGGFGYWAGNCFPGAASPHGLAKVGPDTWGKAWGDVQFLHFDGYYFDDEAIRGFSHLHLVGTGASDYGVLTAMPLPSFDGSQITKEAYGSTYAKASEVAKPGYYGVTLDTGGIRAEFAATEHAALHRHSYASGAADPMVVLFDLGHHLTGGHVPDADVTFDASGTSLRGRLRSVGGMSGGFGGYDVYFVVKSQSAWKPAVSVWGNDAPMQPGMPAHFVGEDAQKKDVPIGFAIAFDAAPVVLKVGLSMVSIDGAEASLDAEIPGFDFDGTRTAVESAWRDRLSRIRVQGGCDEDLRTFYSALHHTMLMPSTMSDRDGKYRLSDGNVHQATGHRFVSDLSLWDTYRTVNPLYDLAYPDVAGDTAYSLTEFAKALGFFPKWSIATGEAGSMIGASAEIVVSDAYQKGIGSFDAEGAYSILRAAAMDTQDPPGGRGGRGDVVPYMQYGYVPASPDKGGTVSITAEYARDDYALAAFAAALGHADDAAKLSARAIGYRQLFDPSIGVLRGKRADGTWNEPHPNPASWDDKDCVEASLWQSVWGVPNDTAGLVDLYGGKDAFNNALETFFENGAMEQDMVDPSNALSVAAPRKYYFAANEPDIHAPYMFSQAGRPDLAAKWIAWARSTYYRATPDGIPGNDDGGAMAAWYVFSALGFFPVPGTDLYVVGTPLFSHAEIDLATGGTFTIDAKGVSRDAIYVKSATLNGAPLDVATFHHADLKPGGSLAFEMGTTPSDWGTH